MGFFDRPLPSWPSAWIPRCPRPPTTDRPRSRASYRRVGCSGLLDWLGVDVEDSCSPGAAEGRWAERGEPVRGGDGPVGGVGRGGGGRLPGRPRRGLPQALRPLTLPQEREERTPLLLGRQRAVPHPPSLHHPPVPLPAAPGPRRASASASRTPPAASASSARRARRATSRGTTKVPVLPTSHYFTTSLFGTSSIWAMGMILPGAIPDTLPLVPRQVIAPLESRA